MIGGIVLGKVKTEQIKRIGKELMTRFPGKFTSNFDENKNMVDTLTQGTTTVLETKLQVTLQEPSRYRKPIQKLETLEEIDEE